MFLTLYLSWNLFVLFVPVMGRIGASNNPDVAVALLAWGVLLWTSAYIVPWIVLLEKPQRVFSALAAVIVASLLVVFMTPFGFPYSGDAKNPTPQRALVHHVDRVFRDSVGHVRHSDSGFWLVNVDYNSPRLLFPHVQGLSQAKLVKEECESELYCGFPHYYPALRLLKVSHWIPGPRPVIHQHTHLQMVDRHDLSPQVTRLSFNLTGPDHMGLFFAPAKGVELVGWEFTTKIPPTWLKMDGRPVYFVYYSCGLPSGPWTFWFDFQIAPQQRQQKKQHQSSQSIVDVAVAGHYLHGEEQLSPSFKLFLNTFPSWSYPLAVTSTYQTWTY